MAGNVPVKSYVADFLAEKRKADSEAEQVKINRTLQNIFISGRLLQGNGEWPARGGDISRINYNLDREELFILLCYLAEKGEDDRWRNLVNYPILYTLRVPRHFLRSRLSALEKKEELSLIIPDREMERDNNIELLTSCHPMAICSIVDLNSWDA